MASVDKADQARVAEAVRRAEGETDGEIVCVFARAAGDYRSVPIIWAAMLALILPWPLIRFLSLGAEAVHLIQLAAFVLGAVVFGLPGLRMTLVPKRIQRARAREMARAQFFARGLSRTAHQTGMLIFVAEAERYAEILVDDGIAAKVDEQVWRSIIVTLTDALKADQPVAGLLAAIELCGAVLAEHCPPAANNPDELPNRLIIL